MKAPSSGSALPPGAHASESGTHFVAFVTTSARCSVRVFREDGEHATHAMTARGDGHHELLLPGVGHGDLYKLVVGDRELPDPYARFLPHGVHGPAMVVEPRHVWRHANVARPLREHVVYELHVGAFSESGTYQGVIEQLPALAELGVTAIELMPVAAFAGARGWGYDGVAHFAPFAPYGTPDQLRELVDHAHGLGLAVLLDVVYNHFGPSGNYLSAFSASYFDESAKSPWGAAVNFAEPAVRAHVIDNAIYWLSEFRFDGLRLDAVHAIVDRSTPHVLQQLAERVRSLSPPRLLFAEDDRNLPADVTQTGFDAIWADDFHHQLRVTLTGERDGYYAAYQPGVAGLARTIERGWLYAGETYPPAGEPRGQPAGELAAERFVYCIQNHDQIGNRALGERLCRSVSTRAYRAASMLLLLLPMTPLLFMGQEWAASSRFLYFTDHDEELGKLVSAGRREEFKTFAAFSEPAAREAIPDPQAPATFAASQLRWSERELAPHRGVLELYRELLALRKSDPVLAAVSRAGLRAEARGDVLLVHMSAAGERRLLAVNLGPGDAPFPSLALDPRWRIILASDGRVGAGLLYGEHAALFEVDPPTSARGHLTAGEDSQR